MTELTLRALLNPVEWPAFIQKYWQREPLHIERRNREFYTGWVSSEEVDYLLATHVGKAGFPLSVIGGQSAPKGNSNPRREGWTPEKVYERFAEGATIRIGNMPAYSASIRRLACSFEALLNTDIGVNLYMTPRNAQAFQAHYDNHDVFIVQIEGEKTWKLFSPPEEWPLEVAFRGRTAWVQEPLPYAADHRTLPPVKDERRILLQAGDLLYVPRGHVHQVFTENIRSLHLTIAAPVVTWYEVAVHALLAASQKSRALREAMPAGFAVEASKLAEAEARIPEVLAEVKTHLNEQALADSLQLLAQQFVHSRVADWSGLAVNVEAAGEITPATMLQIRPTLVHSVQKLGSHICLLFSGRFINLPVRVESMLNHILLQKRFRVGELPTELSDESRVVLAQTLVRRGFLILTDQG